jgi:hypothetical protein
MQVEQDKIVHALYSIYMCSLRANTTRNRYHCLGTGASEGKSGAEGNIEGLDGLSLRGAVRVSLSTGLRGGRWAVGVDAGYKFSRFLQAGIGASNSLS